ncbi:permease-like cell division protein FtsX [Flavobacteriaceae bacterium]|nr:permease-like cell division protein FtsX [Flavobacteriaceae bacterium]
MANSFQEKFQKRRVLTGYLSVVISISLVLFFLGILGLFLLNTRNVASYFKEQIVMTIYLKDSAKDIEIKQLQKKIQLDPATKKINFISKEDAAAHYARDIGEDFLEFLGYNPLLNSIDVNFNAAYVNSIILTRNQNELEATDFIDEVIFDQPLVALLDENILRISYVLIITTLLFVVIALLLINSSIRLSIYSKRFIIKTMQLVGATKSFIRRPFIWTHMQLGILGSLIAIVCLTFVFLEVNKRFPELNMLKQPLELIIVLGGVLFLGVGITGMSTFFATQRYLNLKSDAIY